MAWNKKLNQVFCAKQFRIEEKQTNLSAFQATNRGLSPDMNNQKILYRRLRLTLCQSLLHEAGQILNHYNVF